MNMKNNLKQQVTNCGFPSQKILKQVRTELTTAEHLDRNLVLVGNFSNLDKIKFGVCQAIINYKLDNNLNNHQLSKSLGLGAELLDKLLHLEITAFALDSLVSYTEKLRAPLQVNIGFNKSVDTAKKVCRE